MGVDLPHGVDTLRGMRDGTNLDDVSAVVGYHSTRRLVAWFAGRRVYIPDRIRPGHALLALLGASALRRLIDEWGGQHITLPTLHEDMRLVRDRHIAGMLQRGEHPQAVAMLFDVTVERVGQIRRAMTADGLLDVELENFSNPAGFLENDPVASGRPVAPLSAQATLAG